MFADYLGGFPFLGHLKSLYELACGNIIIAGRDFFRASRSTLVFVGGGIGNAGGPVGMFIGSILIGFVMDQLGSIVTNRPLGFLDATADLIDDLRNRIRPMKGLVKMLLYIVADVLCGCMGALVIRTVNVGNPTAVDIPAWESAVPPWSWMAAGLLVRQVAMTSVPAILSICCIEDVTPFKSDKDVDPQDSDLAIFLKIFKVKNTDDITIRGKRIFANISDKQWMSLKKLLKQLRLNGYIVVVIETVRILLERSHEDMDVSFETFSSVSKFVAAYIGEYVACINEEYIKDTISCPYREERCRIDTDVIKNKILDGLFRTWDDLYTKVGYFDCASQFRNVHCAIYQYWRHKVIPENGDVLSVPQYFGLVKTLMKSVIELKEYEQICDASDTRLQLVYDVSYLNTFGKRVRIVLKVKDGINSSSTAKITACYMWYDIDNCKDGSVFIDKKKKKLK